MCLVLKHCEKAQSLQGRATCAVSVSLSCPCRDYTSTRRDAPNRKKNISPWPRSGCTIFPAKTNAVCHSPSVAHREQKATWHSNLSFLIFTEEKDYGYFCRNLTPLVCYDLQPGIRKPGLRKQFQQRVTR